MCSSDLSPFDFRCKRKRFYHTRLTQKVQVTQTEPSKANPACYEIDELLKLRIPDDKWFNDRGIYNYHGGGSVVFDDDDVINWTLGQRKTEEKQ